MKKNLFFAALLFLNTIVFSQGSWLQKTSLPGNGRHSAFAFAIGSKGYIGCGQTATSTYVNDFWEYEPNEDIWTQKANYTGGARYSPSSFTIDSIAYVCLGFTGQCQNDVWSYSPQTNTWTQKNNFPGSARYGAFSFSIGNKGYIGMGSIGGPPFLTDFWEYNSINDAWIQKTSYNTNVGRIHGTGVSMNNKGYAGLGTDDGNGHFVSDFYEYNPLTNAWTQKANYPYARGGASAFVLSNCAYVGTGLDNDLLYNNNLWKYDPTIDSWISIANLGTTKRNAGIGFAIGNKGYMGFGAGTNSNYMNDLWEYSISGTSIIETSEQNIANVSIDLVNKSILLTMNGNFQKASFKIYNIAGQLLTNEKINNSIQTINISHFAKGTYIYIVNGKDNQSKTDKFIIH